MYIIGISAYYHDSAAAIIKDGKIIAAAEEERFSRVKHDSKFPTEAIKYCLKECGITLDEVSYITFYDKPFIKFERLLETYISYAPKGFFSYLKAIPLWIKNKIFLRKIIENELKSIDSSTKQFPKILFSSHHLSHAASAFYPSPFNKAAVLALDGVGEWATTTAWTGKDNNLKLLWEIDFPHSLGLLYSAFTYFCGFKVNSGEYKLMGLAPYGKPRYVDLIYNHLIDLKEDGTFRLNMEYFDFPYGLTMTSKKFAELFDGPARKKESEITQREKDLARSIQVVTEEIILKLATTLHNETGEENLCLAGGVALNCVANGRLLREGPFKKIWIQPAAGDSGGAIGAALETWYQYLKNPIQEKDGVHDFMNGAFLGPAFSKEEILMALKKNNAHFNYIDEDEKLFQKVAELIRESKVIGWFQGRMEFGPRALGNRSIIGDARNKDMQKTVNLKIKYRESFRPFAPAVIAEDTNNYFELSEVSPYMLLVAKVYQTNDLPAVTHVDFSARIQTVHRETNLRFYQLLNEFKKQSKCSVLLNTSFNLRGEPVVCSPDDAYKCFMRTEMDYLVIGNYILSKSDQENLVNDIKWQNEFELD